MANMDVILARLVDSCNLYMLMLCMDCKIVIGERCLSDWGMVINDQKKRFILLSSRRSTTSTTNDQQLAARNPRCMRVTTGETHQSRDSLIFGHARRPRDDDDGDH
jgi:hypothetical protein